MIESHRFLQCLLLFACLSGCGRALPAQQDPNAVIARAKITTMAVSEIDRYTHQLASEHGEDRLQAIGWFCAHPEDGRPVLRSFFEPLTH